MEERRREKRLELEVALEIKRLNQEGHTTSEYAAIDVTDISKTGIGFATKQELEIDSFYNIRLQIWTKEVIDAVIKIVRNEKKEDVYHYGGFFVGMAETDGLKIDIYRRFSEAKELQQ